MVQSTQAGLSGALDARLPGKHGLRRAAGWTSLVLLLGIAGCIASPTSPPNGMDSATLRPSPGVTSSPAPLASLTPLDMPAPTPSPTVPSPTPRPTPTPTTPPKPSAIRALRLDFASLKNSRLEVDALEPKMVKAQVNLVALGAGRLDWNYFKWEGHADRWSADVTDTGIDFLAQDAARFSKWASVDAVVDVFAPRYVAAHPQAAAISWLGKRSENLVSTTQLVHGDFGDQLLQMLDYIAAHYPVDSISITELAYYIDGYGDDDKAAYLAFTGRSDWPRSPAGLINIDDPSIGQWRSHEIGLLVQRASAVVHRYNKKLYMDVEVNWGNLQRESADKGQDYRVLLQYADRLVVWDYFGLSGYRPDYTAQIARYLNKYGADKVIVSVGLWATGGGSISHEALRQAMQSGLKSNIPNLWITPSLYLSEDHWRVLFEMWASPP